MPQVHNKVRYGDLDPTGFGKNSRFMSTVRFTEGSVKRLNVLNSMQQKLTKIRMDAFNRDAGIVLRKHRRARQRMCDSLRKTMAYQIVARNHPIAEAPDYKKALERRYSFNALKHEIKDMMEQLEPEKVRQRQALALIAENRKRYDELLLKCKRDINAWPSPDVSDNVSEEKDDDQTDQDNALTGPEDKVKLADDIIQHERYSSPRKAAIGPRRQNMTMEFARQSSHLSARVEEPSDNLATEPAGDTTASPVIVTGRKYKLPPLKIHRDSKKGVVEKSYVSETRKQNPTAVQYALPPVKTRHRYESNHLVTAQS